MEITKTARRDCVAGHSYDAVLDGIGECFAAHPSDATAVMAAVRDQLQAFGKSNFRVFLEDAIEQPDWLKEVAARSYLHGNGFYKIILEENEQFRLRLHIWMPATRAEENIHDHRWHFASVILSGRLETEIWEDALSSGGETLNDYLYIGKDIGARNLLMGKARVSLKERVAKGEGDAYYMMSNVMHRIVYDGQELVCTLLCHAKGARNWARTITRHTEEPNIDHGCINADELKSVLGLALLELKKSPLAGSDGIADVE